MALKLPLYLIVGEKPIAVWETPDGGMGSCGWDFARGDLTRDAVSWDEIVGHLQEGVPVRGSSDFAAGGDTFRISAAEFEAHVAELRARAAH